MRNAFLPPIASHVHCFGNNEAQTPFYLKPSMDNQISFLGNEFCMESKLLNSDFRFGGTEGFDIPTLSQSLVHFNHYKPDNLVSILGCQELSFQSSMFHGNYSSSTHQQLEAVSQLEELKPAKENAKKRSIEFTTNNNRGMSEEFGKNKRSKFESLQPNRQQETKEASVLQLQVPARRSQKLTDKITALQQLVSPYGKTDTASVLQEACVYIKLLQEQIKNLFQTMSSSYNSYREQHSEEFEDTAQDLRSRGLCLVPISITQKATMENRPAGFHST